MKDFDALQNLWQQPAAGAPQNKLPQTLSSTAVTNKIKLYKQQRAGAVMLVVTGSFVALLGIFGKLNFHHWYTYAGMAMISLICYAQAALMYYTGKKIIAIDDTAIPAIHLKQWEAYYAFRQKQISVFMPVYYIGLNLAMVLYTIEIFTGRPIKNVLIFVAVYAAWMLFAYYYLGKRTVKKETARMQVIMDELNEVVMQLKS